MPSAFSSPSFSRYHENSKSVLFPLSSRRCDTPVPATSRSSEQFPSVSIPRTVRLNLPQTSSIACINHSLKAKERRTNSRLRGERRAASSLHRATSAGNPKVNGVQRIFAGNNESPYKKQSKAISIYSTFIVSNPFHLSRSIAFITPTLFLPSNKLRRDERVQRTVAGNRLEDELDVAFPAGRDDLRNEECYFKG